MADFLAETQAPAAPKPVTFRKFDDIAGQRQAVYDQALEGVRARFPIQNVSHRIELVNADYAGDFNPTRREEKDALMSGGRLHRPIKGTLRLVDNATNSVLDERSTVLAHIPHLNSRGLFIHNGTPWAIRNQARLRPGVYVRKQQNGGVEAHFNIHPKSGRGFRVNLEPDSGVFKVQIDQSTTRLYPLMKVLGVEDDAMKAAWGDDLFKANWRGVTGHDVQDLRKVVQKLGRGPEKEAGDADLGATLKSILARSKVDEDVTELTLGARHGSPDASVLLKTTGKILRVAKGEQGDNRDSQAFQSIHSAEDLIRERLERDQSGAAKKLLWNATKTGKLDKLSSGLMTPNIHTLFRGSGLAQAIEDINPYETFDSRQAVTRMGEGGITSTLAVSRDARGVQPSYFGLIDGTRAPESSNIGLDMRVTDSAMKGSDGQLYTTLRDSRTGAMVPTSARQMAKKTVAFPGEMASGSRKVRAMVGDKIRYVNRNKVDFELPDATHMFSRASNMIPMAEGVKSQRLLMGARMTTQALPVREAEAPLVQSVDHDGKSFYEQMGKHAGAVHAEEAGRVIDVQPDSVTLMHPGGRQQSYELYNHYPLARKTMLHNTAVVKNGDIVQAGQLLAHSNFTDKKGNAAPGLNMRVGYLSGHGATYEDAIVISESAAKRLASEHQYKHTMDLGKEVHSTKTADYKSVYTDKFTKDQYGKLDDDGVVKVGETINPGDPVMVAIGKKQGRALGALMKSDRSMHTDMSQTWDHPQPGTVTDVVRTRSGVKVSIKSYEPMTVGSKMSNQYGGKGVVSTIIPDGHMPHDKDGKPMEVLMSPLGIITRVNPAVLVSTLLGKVAAKTGQPYQMKSFGTKDGLAQFALNEAKKHGVDEHEDLTDPRDGRKIPNVFTGMQYMLKLHHTAESKLGARDTGGYGSDESPARGGAEGSKRIGLLDVHSLLSSGATEFLKDAKLVRGQRNDEYWRALKMGETPTAPRQSFANQHFTNLLKAAGVNVRELPNNKRQLAFLTDSDIDKLAQHEITEPDTIDFNTLKPKANGLFDLGKTGGDGGERWTKVALPAKIPNPLAEDPIVRVLGLTKSKFEAILGGKEKIGDKTGPDAIEAALKGINVDREIEVAKHNIRTGRDGVRDSAVRTLGYLTGLKNQGLKPEDLMLSKMPVLPPKFRPIMRARGVDIIHDANHLYHDLIHAKKNFIETKAELGEAGEQYLNMYNAAKAVSGLHDPVGQKSIDQGVKGMLRFAIGVKDSPKYSRFQRKVIGNSVDTVGRSVITIDPDLDMDSIGIPEDMAWTMFRPFMIRRLVQQGTPAMEAIKHVRDRTKTAEHALQAEMKERPVVYNRAPSLHRYNYVGGMARINKGRSDISIAQVVTKGLGADFDGDAINVHVPVSREASDEVKKKLFPSNNLLHPATFDVHLEPTQEFLAGLYLASQKDSAKPVRYFASAEDAKRAYARGEIGVQDPIHILDDN